MWLFEYDGEITLSKAETDEVKQAKWLSVPQIKELYDSGELVATLGYFSEKFDA